MKSQGGHFWVWIGLAVLIRVILMPFTFHGDLFFVHYFPFQLSHSGIWDVYGFFEDHYFQRGYTYYGPLIYYVMAFFQWLLGPLDPGFGAFMSGIHERVYAAPFSAMEYVKLFSSKELSYQLFWMKLPYLFADVGALVLLRRLFEDPRLKEKATIFWAFHPVVIFSGAMFGQYRSFTALLLWACLLFFYNKRLLFGAGCIGLLLLMDSYFPWLLVPVAVLVFGRNFKERIKISAAIALPYLAVMLPLTVSSGYVWSIYFSPIARQMAEQSLFHHYVRETVFLCKFVFGAVSLVLLLYLFPTRTTLSDEQRFRLFCAGSFILVFTLFATATTHIHYLMWGLPFFFLMDLDKSPWPRILSVGLFVLLFLFNLNSHAIYFVMPSGLRPLPWFASSGAWGAVVASSRLLFSLLCLYFCYRVWRERVQKLC